MRLTSLPVLAAVTAAVLAGCSSDDDPPGAAPSPAAPSTSAPAPTTDTSTADTSTAEATTPDPAVAAALAQLETDYAARLGVYAVDTGTRETVEHRADERFAFASTHKALSAAAVLQATDAAALDDVIQYDAADVVGHSPVTEPAAGTGLTLLEVIRAAITVSDNTAANLLFEQLGGPDGLEAAVRGFGDDTTSFDRIEPGLSDWAPGETRDTTTPRAMAANLERLALGDLLAADDRAVLVDAMRDNTTGDELIRAGVPDGWPVADKTGSAGHGGRNDIAVIEPPDSAPIVLAVYSNRLDPEAESDPALIAAAATIVVDALTG
ncbi:class A beta-lactamase [Jiangella ureilytica]|uniref:Beta-lactamase n=1 Tax=Jiangella ureilytica TaxID=2530374 RepID=A0A4R4RNX3_9ACTN|nr:class A beta-lactamase [Jiangella ureilytica]TDC51511.1 class A beta-lactamase [Jiangella ureilytica]